ncbi:MAG: hypothetical protein NZ775_08315 [Gammaproteobacteria bacterium]|nr:hypothetical protein [Gammaproteobacteria bacterium]
MLDKIVKSSILLTLIFFGNPVFADGHTEAKPYPTFGIETFACNYNKEKDLDDLLKVGKKWSQWATETMEHPYSAWIFTPMFFDKPASHDVYWLGASDSLTTLGAVQDQWLKIGGKYQKAFNKVVTCDRHTVFGGESLRDSLDSTASGNAQLFACSFKETSTPEKFLAATKGFREFVDTLNLKEGIWRWWPRAGYFEYPDWDFLEVVGSGSLEERFANQEKFDAHDGIAKWTEYNADVLECSYVGDSNYIQVKE